MSMADTMRPSVQSLSRWLNRWDKWKALCNAMQAAPKDTPEYDRALAAWSRGKPPSKASKHQAYSSAYQLNQYLELGLPRASDVDGLRAILAAAKAAVR